MLAIATKVEIGERNKGENAFGNHLYVAASVGPVPAGATTGGLHQDATEHLPGAFMVLRRACPGGSTTCGLGACQLNRCSRRDRPDGERDILLALVANQL